MSTPYNALLKVKIENVYLISEALKKTSVRRHKTTWFKIAVIGLLHLTENKKTEHLSEEFRVSETSIRNYIDKVILVLEQLLPTSYTDLDAALNSHRELLLDGSFFHKQSAFMKGYWSFKHKTCGVNVQFLTDLQGKPVWFSSAYPGSVPDVTAARTLDLPGAAATHGSVVYADKGYVGLVTNRLGQNVNSICTLSKIYKNTPKEVRDMNRVLSQIRRPVETLFARIKQYGVLKHFRRSLTRFDSTLKAVVSLHLLEDKTW